MQRANNLPAQLSRIRLINVKAMESTPVRLHIALIPGFLYQILSSSTLKVKNANLCPKNLTFPEAKREQRCPRLVVVIF